MLVFQENIKAMFAGKKNIKNDKNYLPNAPIILRTTPPRRPVVGHQTDRRLGPQLPHALLGSSCRWPAAPNHRLMPPASPRWNPCSEKGGAGVLEEAAERAHRWVVPASGMTTARNSEAA